MLTPFWIVGEQRSGTTLLADLLHDQPGVCVRVGLLGRVLDCAAALRVDLRAPSTVRERHALASAANRALAGVRIEGRLRPEHASALDLISALLSHVAEDGRVGSKDHAPVEMMEPLLHAGVRVLFIVRDARDVLLSRFFRGDPHLDQKLLTWCISARAALALRHRHFHRLRYEDLVRDPRATFEQLAAAWSWDLDPDRPAAWRLPAGRATNTSFHQELPRVDARPTERWRAHLDEPWVRYASTVCGRELAALGYDPGPPATCASARATAAAGLGWSRSIRAVGPVAGSSTACSRRSRADRQPVRLRHTRSPARASAVIASHASDGLGRRRGIGRARPAVLASRTRPSSSPTPAMPAALPGASPR